MPKIQKSGIQYSTTIPKEIIINNGWQKGDEIVFLQKVNIVVVKKIEDGTA